MLRPENLGVCLYKRVKAEKGYNFKSFRTPGKMMEDIHTDPILKKKSRKKVQGARPKEFGH